VTEPRPAYNVAIGDLRAFVTVLVVAHHAVLAYHPFAPPAPESLITQPRWWQAFPVLDKERWTGFALFAGFNDVFFMALMFFLSGLFVAASLRRKGPGTYLADRLRRLGLPFLVGAAIVAPLAYYPAYMATTSTPTIGGFWRVWLSLGTWPAGPAWFLWVLLVFDAFAVTLSAVAPRWTEPLGRAAGALGRPIVFFVALLVLSAAVYVPLTLVVSPLHWTAVGPFSFQTARFLHYLVYFLAGVGVGAHGLDAGLLAPQGKLARRWPLWLTAAIVAFVVATAGAIAASNPAGVSRGVLVFSSLGFVLSCAASSFASLAIFVRFVRRTTPLGDSLRDNAYGIYVVHYAFVSWLQLALVGVSAPAFVKGVLVIVAAVVLSWMTTALLRRIPAVARVI
jgi:hypothetical protein